MSFENIQIAHGNFTIDRTGAAFYTMSHTTTTLIKKQSDGTVIFAYFLEQPILEVQSLQFDGVHFWSLEKQGIAGFRIRKWLIGTDDLVRVVTELSYGTDAVNKYNVNSMAVEFYSDTLDNQVLVGATSFDVNDGSVIRTGDRITIGPSTEVGFTGKFFSTLVLNKVGTTLTVTNPLTVGFAPNDDVFFTRSFFVFSDTAPGGAAGALYKFRAFDGFQLSLNVSNMFNNVRGATFFKDNLMFVKAGEVIWLNPVSQKIFKSQAIDNLNQARGEYHTTFDLAGFSDTVYRLEQKHVFFDAGPGQYSTENWAPLFNYNTSSTIPEVYFVAVKAEPPVLHSAVSGLTPTSNILVQVLDQFRTPVFNKTVDLTSNGGSLNPVQGTTDADGLIKSVYTANAGVGEVTVTATVP